MLVFFHFTLIAAIAADAYRDRESAVNNTKEVIKGTETYCENITMHVNDVTYQVLDRTENKILLDVGAAFEKVNVEEFTIAGCIKKIKVNFACESKEKCCHPPRQSQEMKSTSTTLGKSPPIETFTIYSCRKQNYICISYMTFVDPKWHRERKRLDGLPPCKETCDNLSWTAYTKILEEYEIDYVIDNKTGDYIVDWVSGLEERVHAGCLSQVTLYFCTKYDSSTKKITDTVNNFTTKEPVAIRTNMCGNMCVMDAFLMFQRGDYEYFRKVDLRNIPECTEESALWTYVGIVSGIVVGVILIAFLFYYLFRSEKLRSTNI